MTNPPIPSTTWAVKRLRGGFKVIDATLRFPAEIKLGKSGVKDAPGSPRMPPTGIGVRKSGETSISPQARRYYAELAKTWLAIADDLADLESQLRAAPDKKAG